jgi:hypothetical protein
VGLGTEILFVLMLGLLVLGPKQLHSCWNAWHGLRLSSKRQPAASSLNWARNLMLRIGTAKPTVRMNWLGASDPSSGTRYRNSKPAD